jgi:hypothetical protein
VCGESAGGCGYGRPLAAEVRQVHRGWPMAFWMFRTGRPDCRTLSTHQSTAPASSRAHISQPTQHRRASARETVRWHASSTPCRRVQPVPPLPIPCSEASTAIRLARSQPLLAVLDFAPTLPRDGWLRAERRRRRRRRRRREGASAGGSLSSPREPTDRLRRLRVPSLATAVHRPGASAPAPSPDKAGCLTRTEHFSRFNAHSGRLLLCWGFASSVSQRA